MDTAVTSDALGGKDRCVAVSEVETCPNLRAFKVALSWAWEEQLCEAYKRPAGAGVTRAVVEKWSIFRGPGQQSKHPSYAVCVRDNG